MESNKLDEKIKTVEHNFQIYESFPEFIEDALDDVMNLVLSLKVTPNVYQMIEDNNYLRFSFDWDITLDKYKSLFTIADSFYEKFDGDRYDTNDYTTALLKCVPQDIELIKQFKLLEVVVDQEINKRVNKKAKKNEDNTEEKKLKPSSVCHKELVDMIKERLETIFKNPTKVEKKELSLSESEESSSSDSETYTD
jgi:hypothetical protein